MASFRRRISESPSFLSVSLAPVEDDGGVTGRQNIQYRQRRFWPNALHGLQAHKPAPRFFGRETIKRDRLLPDQRFNMQTRGRAFRELAECLGPALHEIPNAAAIDNRLARPRHEANTANHPNHNEAPLIRQIHTFPIDTYKS